MNYKMILNTLGRVILLESALLLLPAGVALIYGETCVTAFVITALIAAAVGGTLCIICRSEKRNLSIRDGFAIVSLSWIGISLIGALPFVISGEIPSFVDAFFETVSGFTTTGASILKDVESMSHGLLFWRSFTHWLGGMGVLVFIMAIMNKAPDRSINILRAEMPGHTVDKFTPKSKNAAKTLYYIYLAMTAVELVLLLCGGMPLFDSVVHALGTAGTGGFGIKGDSIASYSPYLQWVITVFMLLFGVSFNIYYLLLLRRWKNAVSSNELWCYLGIFAAAVVIVTVNIYPMYHSISESVRLSAFQVSSILTTTGFATADFNLWPQLSKGVLIMLMFVGGCMGSTAGGLKISRLTSLFQIARNEIRHSISPRAVRAVRLNGRTLSAQEEKGLLSYLVLYLSVIAATFLLISFEPLGFETNFSATIACVNNIGPGFNLVGPAANYSVYSAFSKVVLSIAMLMGRLEIYPLLSLLSPQLWAMPRR